MNKILGTKKLMTQVFMENGEVVPVTVIDLSDAILAKKTDSKVYIGIGKKKNTIKPEDGNFKELGFVPRKYIEAESKIYENQKIGDKIDLSILSATKEVDISGISKGKGFAGVVKRHGFKGGSKTHGQSDRRRAPGAIGAGTTPGRVLKGKKMAGRMGGKLVTTSNLKVIKLDTKNRILLVKGAVPGTRNTVVIIKFK